MLYEVEVLADGNSPMDLNRVFDLLDDPKPVIKIFTADFMGQDRWCQVTGWSDQGQCAAYAVQAEDSGDGVILLIYGGNEGIRLKPDDSVDDWELENDSQWGEPCLMLAADTKYVEPD
jgi:hypothetical protein